MAAVEAFAARTAAVGVGIELLAALMLLSSPVAHAQKTADIGFKSVGRAAPLAAAIPGDTPANPAKLEDYPESNLVVGPFRPKRVGRDGKPVQVDYGSAWNGAVPKGVKPLAGRSLHVEGLLPGPRALDRQALFPLQQPVGDRGPARLVRRHRLDRQRPAALGGVGLLRQGLPALGDREPLPVQDRAGALRGAARGDEDTRRADPALERDGARLVGPLRAGRGARTGTPRCYYNQMTDDPVAADARVSDADGAVRVSRLGHRRAAIGPRSTAGPKASCGVGTITPSRTSRTRSS